MKQDRLNGQAVVFEFKEEPIKSNENIYHGNKYNNSLPTSSSFENPVEPKRWPHLMILKSSGVFATRLFMDAQALPQFDAQSRSRMVWISSGTGDSEPERRLPEQILNSSSAALPWHARPLFLKKGRTRSRQPPAAKLLFYIKTVHPIDSFLRAAPLRVMLLQVLRE